MITRRCRAFSDKSCAKQLLHAQRPAEIHIHPGQVIHPIGVRNLLARSQIFANLFRAAMQVAQVGRDFRYDLAVSPEDQPQHAVRAGMLRPHVDEHFVGTDIVLDDALVADLCRHMRFNALECRGIPTAFHSLYGVDARPNLRGREYGGDPDAR